MRRWIAMQVMEINRSTCTAVNAAARPVPDNITADDSGGDCETQHGQTQGTVFP